MDMDHDPPALPGEVGTAGAGQDEAAPARGWDAIAEWTGGLAPDAVEALRGVRELEFVYPLLHALVGHSLREFFVRAGPPAPSRDRAKPPRWSRTVRCR
jgi:hypothetical protein